MDNVWIIQMCADDYDGHCYPYEAHLTQKAASKRCKELEDFAKQLTERWDARTSYPLNDKEFVDNIELVHKEFQVIQLPVYKDPKSYTKLIQFLNEHPH